MGVGGWELGNEVGFSSPTPIPQLPTPLHAEGVFDSVEEAAGLFGLGLLFEGGGELLQELALLVGQVGRGFDAQADLEVAAAAAVEVRHALAAQAHRAAGLGAGRDLEPGRLVEGGDLDLVAEGGLGDVDRQVGHQVVGLAAEVAVRLDVDHQVEVAGRAAVGARLALVAQPDLRAVVDAARDAHLEGAVDPHHALAAALLARIGDDRAVAVAAVADADVDELAEEVLVDPPQLAAAATPRTLGRRGAGLDAVPGTLGAGFVLLEGNLALEPEDRLLELERDVDPQVGPALDPLALARPPGRGPEERLEQVLDADPAAAPERPAA